MFSASSDEDGLSRILRFAVYCPMSAEPMSFCFPCGTKKIKFKAHAFSFAALYCTNDEPMTNETIAPKVEGQPDIN